MMRLLTNNGRRRCTDSPDVVAVAPIHRRERLTIAGEDLTVAGMNLIGARQVIKIFQYS